MKNKKNQSKGAMVFDMLFEIILILVILLVAMLLSKDDVIAGPNGYTLEPLSMILTFGIMIFFLVFMIKTSIKKQKEDGDLDKILEAQKKEEENA